MQRSLFDNAPTCPGAYGQPAAPHNGTPTSRAAAESIGSDRIRQAHRDLVALLRSAGGLTREQIAGRLGWSGDYTRPRVREALDLGLIREQGERPTATGRKAALLWAREGER
jgi:hypothetical protein